MRIGGGLSAGGVGELGITFHIPMPPSKNRQYTDGRTKGGHKQLAPAYAKWRDEAGWELRRQYVGTEPITCRFDLYVEVPAGRLDPQNTVDPIFDLLERVGIVANDRNVRSFTFVDEPDRTDCLVYVQPLHHMPGIKQASTKKPRTSPVRSKKPTQERLRRYRKAGVLV